MIVFNEGTPGAGKSYDAVLTHLLPAIAKGRKVFVRLDGLKLDRIAKHLKMDEADVVSLVHLLDANEVATLYDVATPDSLIIVDEAHMYWVANRNPLSPEWEKFFAEHRHDGQDLVLISQWYKRLHSAVRARVERKCVFTKMQALGMKNRYQVRYYTAIEPDKYEKVGSKTLKYDARIFPLYESVVQGTENLETYDAGGRTVWAKFLLPALIVVPAAIFGVVFLLRFFTGNVDIVDKAEKPNAPVVEKAAPRAGFGPSVATERTLPSVVMPVPAEPPKPAGVAYVWKLTAENRPRVAGTFNGKDGVLSIVEWRSEQGHVIERLTSKQLAALGVNCVATSFGVRMTFMDEVIVATAYPTEDNYGRISDARLRAIDESGSRPASLASGSRTAPSTQTRLAQRSATTMAARPEFAYRGVDAQ